LKIEQRMADQERLALGIGDRGKMLGVRFQRFGQSLRRLLGPLGDVCLDDRNNGFSELGKGFPEFDVVLAERHIRRDHLGGAGIYRQVSDRVA
jgi:hypothetical protein